MKTYVSYIYISLNFSENREISKVLGQIKTYILPSITFFQQSRSLWVNVEKT